MLFVVYILEILAIIGVKLSIQKFVKVLNSFLISHTLNLLVISPNHFILVHWLLFINTIIVFELFTFECFINF